MSEQKEKNMPEEKLPEAKLPESAPVSEGEALTALADAILAIDEPEEIADVPEDDELEPTHGARGKKEKPEDTQKSREERLSNLIEKGKKAGKLTSKELMDTLDDLKLEPDELDKFYDKLENLGIDTSGGKRNADGYYVPLYRILAVIIESVGRGAFALCLREDLRQIVGGKGFGRIRRHYLHISQIICDAYSLFKAGEIYPRDQIRQRSGYTESTALLIGRDRIAVDVIKKAHIDLGG